MPLRPRRCLLTLCLLSTALHAENDLNWVDKDSMRALPAAQQLEIPGYCSGIYYNPSFNEAVASRDTIVTAKTSRLIEGGVAELSGDVEIRQPTRILHAEQAQLDQASGDFSMSGDIRVEMPNLTFTAQDLVGNTKRQQATLFNVDYALFELHARGTADQIKHDKGFTEIGTGSYTTCPPDSNAWLLSADNIELDQEKGWGEAENVVLRVQRVPVIWLPWITFPIDDRRKTGLLFPTVGSSDAGGVDVSVPIYLNLHPQYDATLAPRHIHGRGNGLETDFRYLTHYGTGELTYSWLYEDRDFDDRNRTLATWQHGSNHGRWFFNSDYNNVSDDFYFKDLDNGIQSASQTQLPRLGQARYLGRTWQFLARLQAWQTIDPLLAEADLPYQRLPQLKLTGDPTLVGPVKMEWLSDYSYFDRDADLPTDDVLGQRFHAQPAMVARLENSWGYVQPRARLYYTSYELSENGATGNDSPEGYTWGYNLDAGMVFERLIADNTFVQTLEPRIFFNHVDYADQSSNPLFDSDELTPSYAALFRENRFTGYDRIGDEESTTLAVSSRFLDPHTGEETLRLRIGQKIYNGDRLVQLDGDVETDSTSPLITEANMRLTEEWHVEVFNHWNSSIDKRDRNGVNLNYTDNARRLLSLGVTDRPRDDILQGELAAVVPVHSQWNLVGRWFHDINRHLSLETLAGVEYRDCCWGVRLVTMRELTDRDGDGTLDPETSWMMQIVFNGLGGFGGRIDSLLQRSIPGYRSPHE